MYISLPITTGKNKMVIQELIDDFIASEVMDGDDKWNCPRCKVPRRATKTLTIARLPPIVIIQLKRFTTKNGVFWDKSENHVIFPIRGLDLTRYVPHRQQRGNEDMDDPRTQIGPFKYDLFGVSNHIGTLSSGHCEYPSAGIVTTPANGAAQTLLSSGPRKGGRSQRTVGSVELKKRTSS